MRSWVCLLAVAACARQAGDQTVLHPDDLKPNEDLPFDEGNILDVGSLTDSLALPTAKEVQFFLDKTPYSRPSFLATYSSNGVRAADAIARAADKYQINPIVFLVRAEVDQGLVGNQYYPAPPQRVEYVFGCGCGGGISKCDPAFAGFDKQVDCLGASLRLLLDEVVSRGATASGWGPNRAQRTSDGKDVTPTDEGTATVYAYTPYIGLNKPGGTWVFWNIWQNYAAFAGYAGSLGPPVGTKRWIGDACTSDPLCAAIPEGVCVQNFPSGMCTTACSKTQPCPNDMEHPQSFCGNFGQQGGFCLLACNRSNPASCRSGYTCQSANELGTSTNRDGCLPKP